MRAALVDDAAQTALEFAGRVDDANLKVIVAGPRDGAAGFEVEESHDPVDVQLASATSELGVEVNLVHVDTERLSVRFDVGDRSQFTGADDLELVEKKDGHTCGLEQFDDLWPSAITDFLLRVAVHTRLAHPVRFIEDEAVKVVRLGRHELVEVTEHLRDARVAPARHLPQRGREASRTGGMDDAPPLPSELTHERQGDHRLAAARATADDDGCLRVRLPRALDGVKHMLVGGALLVEENELLSLLHLVSRHREKLPTRFDLATEQRVSRVAAMGVRGKCRGEKIDELRPTLAGEDSGHVVGRAKKQVGDAGVGGVVQICLPAEVVVVRGEERREIGEVLAIARHLQARMEVPTATVGRNGHQGVALLEPRRLAPLLQLDHDVRRVTCAWVHTCEYDVGTTARQRQLVFEEHLDVVEARVAKILDERGQAGRPRFLLARAWPPVRLHCHLLRQEVDERVLDRRIPPYRSAVKMQEQPPGSTKPCGGGMFLHESPSSPL